MTCSPLAISDVGNVIVCTSSTRPTGTQRYTGRTIFETDTGKMRTWNGANWVGNGVEGYAQITASSATATTLADVAGLAVTWTADVSRIYKVTVEYMALQSSPGAHGNVWIRNGAGAQLNVQTRYMANAAFAEGGSLVHRLIAVSGSQTVKVSIDNAGGAGALQLAASALYPNFIMVEDIT